MKRDKVFIGSLMIHPAGTNPYVASREGQSPSGDQRVELLWMFRDGMLPREWWAWDDNEKVRVTDPAAVDWEHMRDEKLRTYRVDCCEARPVGAIGMFTPTTALLDAVSRRHAEARFRKLYETRFGHVLVDGKPNA